MIPKIIHYCWFGGNPLPKLAKKCIKSWKKFCPDYKIIEWNESNFDLSSAPLYVRQAYEAKKWAFVTDYVRLKVVYENGGIYLDTDVEIIKPIDNFLGFNAYFGFEDKQHLATGLGFGAVKRNELLYSMMQDYNNIVFLKENGQFDLLSCPIRNSHVFQEYGFNLDGTTQIINNIVVFSPEYFCPRAWNTKEIKVTENTYTIHHFAASWQSKKHKLQIKKRVKQEKRERKLLLFKSKIKKIFGDKIYNKLKSIKRFFTRKGK